MPGLERMDPTVLVIDDATDSEQLLALRVGNSQVSPLHACSGEEGIMLARVAQPDLVLLDPRLPDIGGLEVCERLKGCPETWSIPVIFVSDPVDVAVRVRAFECGAIDYVTRPFELAELQARVRTALRSKQCEDMLATQVRIDVLTGMWNRGHFETRLAEELAAYKRYGRQLAIVLIDIDNFQRFNEVHGHPTGDLALQQFAESLRQCVRKTDTASRSGGGQFAIMLRETGIGGAAAYAKRLSKQFESLCFGADGPRLGLTVSIGVAASELWTKAAPLDVARIMARADFALYNAKRSGRNRIELATAA